MHRTTGANHVNNRFVAENINTGQPPTQITADWMNSVQEELVAIVEDAGLVLNVNDNAQVLEAVKLLIVSEGKKTFMGQGADIPDNADLNSYITKGIYHQNANAYAANGDNYPIAYAGKLDVFSDGNMVYQTYTTYNAPQKIYTRSRYSGTWLAWSQLWSATNDGAGSGLDADKLDGKHASDFIGAGSIDWDDFPIGYCQPFVPSVIGQNITSWLVAHPKWGLLKNSVPNAADRAMVLAGSSHVAGTQFGDADAVVVEHTHPINGRKSNDPQFGLQHDSSSEDDRGVLSELSGNSGAASNGESGANKNIPPSYALDWIIKIE